MLRAPSLVCLVAAAAVIAPAGVFASTDVVPTAATASTAPGSATAAAPAPTGELRIDWRSDFALTAVTGIGWVTSESAKSLLAPAACRWCQRNGLDDAVTRRLGWEDLHRASVISDVTAFGIAPALTLGSLALAANADDRLGKTPEDALLVVQAVAVSAALNQIVKFTVGRERPFVAELPEPAKARTATPSDNNLSFYSGHSSLAFALAVSAGTVSHLRGYRYEPLVWSVGLPVASFVAYSRIAAKKHYFSDVLVGSVAGAGLGFALPYFLHWHAPASAPPSQWSVSATPRTVAIAWVF